MHNPIYKIWVILFFVALSTHSGLSQGDYHCATCKKEFAKGFTVKGRFYCPEHVNSALPHCHNCDRAINGTYTQLTEQKYSICDSCRNDFAQCFLCSMPADPQTGGLDLRDGRAICGQHRKTAVKSTQEAKRLFKQASSEVKDTFGRGLNLKKPVKDVRLVGFSELEGASHKSGHGNGLKAGRVLGLTTIVFVTQGSKKWLEPAVIHLLNNVPARRMLGVCAHEYAHVWHAQNHDSYSETQPILREGFAEWVAYKVAQRHGRSDQMKLMLNPNGGVYYRGLRKFLELERRRGVDGVLSYAKQAKKI